MVLPCAFRMAGPDFRKYQVTDFNSLGLSQPLVAALEHVGYTTPTPIQLQAIPPGLEGKDILGIAQTGTGKTAAFALPILNRLIGNPAPRRKCATRVLVLAPTRELATQIADSFRDYALYHKLAIMTVFGGVPIPRQQKQLMSGVDVLVATPGRLLDLIDRRALLLDSVEVLVLDEADQMLDLGFIHSLKRIAGLLPRQRQSLFFSATMPPAIAELAGRFLVNPVKVAVAPVATTAERVQQLVTFVNQSEKQALLTLTLRQPEFGKCLVFTRTKHGADRVVRHLTSAGIRSAAIHGNKSQPQRERALEAFKRGESGVLVATDIAARGIDIDAVSHVINFELPNVPEQYVHRIGRTARAGLGGVAVSFCAPDEKAYLRDIEKLTRMKIDPLPLPANFLTEAARLPKPVPVSEADERHDRARRGEVGTHKDAPRRFGNKPGGNQGGNRFGDARRPAESRFGDARPTDARRADTGRAESGRAESGRAESGQGERTEHRHPASERSARPAGGGGSRQGRPASGPGGRSGSRPQGPRSQARG